MLETSIFSFSHSVFYCSNESNHHFCLICCLQMVSIWFCPKFCHLVRVRDAPVLVFSSLFTHIILIIYNLQHPCIFMQIGRCGSLVVKRFTINPEVQGSIPSPVGNFLRHLVFPTHLEVNWFETQR